MPLLSLVNRRFLLVVFLKCVQQLCVFVLTWEFILYQLYSIDVVHTSNNHLTLKKEYRYTTSRRSKVKVLPPGPHESPKDAFVKAPKLRS
jgi:hypothetical protein